MDVEKLRSRLQEYGQGHLLDFYATLGESEKEILYKELCGLDLARIKHNYDLGVENSSSSGQKDDRLKPLPDAVRDSLATADKARIESWQAKGLREIAESKVAVLLLAGGQGTRLNVPYPKGMYAVGLPSGKTLYQIQAERILKVQELAQKKYGQVCIVTWYIMTSEHTQHSTQEFFAKHKYFGLKKENIVLFEQNTFPCFAMDGKIILSAPGKIAKAPDGNGGLYKALGDRKIVEDMKRRGIESVHVYGVDNILVKVADPVFIGFCVSKSAECGAKVVEKQHPTEKVGVICLLDGKFKVVEYSEISLETAQKRNHSGHLVFNAGNIVNHFFTVDFLSNVVSNYESELTPHVAKKKIPFVDEKGECVKPTKENGMKLEKFVFDVFEFAQHFAVLEVIRDEEFSPLKNAPGSPKDTAETARDDLCNLHYQYIVQAGGKFLGDNGEILPDIPSKKIHPDIVNGTVWCPQVQCEISPLLSYAGEGLREHVEGHKFLAAQSLHLNSNGDKEIKNGDSPPTKKQKADQF